MSDDAIEAMDKALHRCLQGKKWTRKQIERFIVRFATNNLNAEDRELLARRKENSRIK